MSFYSNIANTASSLITKFGKSITISRDSGTFDPVLGEDSGVTTASQTIKAVVLPASGGKIQALDLRYGLNGLVYEKLNYFMISGSNLTFTPEPNDDVTIGSEVWKVLGVTPLNPNDGDAIVYEVAIRI